MFVEYRTAVDMLFVRLRHRPSTRFRGKDSFVTIGLQLRQKEAVELLRFYFL